MIATTIYLWWVSCLLQGALHRVPGVVLPCNAFEQKEIKSINVAVICITFRLHAGARCDTFVADLGKLGLPGGGSKKCIEHAVKQQISPNTVV